MADALKKAMLDALEEIGEVFSEFGQCSGTENDEPYCGDDDCQYCQIAKTYDNHIMKIRMLQRDIEKVR